LLQQLRGYPGNHIRILADAEDDLEEGRIFYEKQGRNVGNYFWDCLLSDIESLAIYAGIHRKEFDFFRMLSKRFPYCIYYSVEGDTATVIAVLPMRRDPFWISTKMGGRRREQN
jgi:plasmid stabilization system protein ParE